MNNQTSGKPEGASSALPNSVRGALGVFVVVVSILVTLYALFRLPTYFNKRMNPTANQQCWELREVQSTILKFNKCTGEALQVHVGSAPSAASAPLTK